MISSRFRLLTSLGLKRQLNKLDKAMASLNSNLMRWIKKPA